MVPYQLRGLSWPGILSKSINNAPDLLADYPVKPLERLTRLITEDDL